MFRDMPTQFEGTRRIHLYKAPQPISVFQLVRYFLTLLRSIWISLASQQLRAEKEHPHVVVLSCVVGTQKNILLIFTNDNLIFICICFRDFFWVYYSVWSLQMHALKAPLWTLSQVFSLYSVHVEYTTAIKQQWFAGRQSLRIIIETVIIENQ